MPTTIAENLRNIQSTKLALKASINAKNVGAINDSTPFSAYPSAIDSIEVGGIDMSDNFVSGCLEIKDYHDSEFLLSKCVTSVNIPDGVTSFKSMSFQDCSSLTGITIPESVTSFDDWCFSRCLSFKSITIPDGVTSLPNYCFQGCKSLSSVTIGNSVTSLGYYCFYSCSSLTGITIPESVTSLGYSCFQNCSSLPAIIIPDAVTKLGHSCFSNCSSLTSVTCKPTTPPTLESHVFFNTHSTLVIYVPAESVDAYKSATNWSSYADKIQAIA